MANETGLRLEFPNGRPAVTDLEAINSELKVVGSRIWPLDHRHKSDGVRRLLRQPSLSDAEIEQVMADFMLPRERLLEMIAEAGREPQVADGGNMSTYVSPHDYSYPQLFIVEDGIDYSRFDRFHINITEDGIGVDEFMHVLAGSGVRVLQRMPGGGVLTLHIDCPDDDHGWVMTYDGIYHHIGSISGASQGTKVLMQVIGPQRWVMRYEDEL